MQRKQQPRWLPDEDEAITTSSTSRAVILRHKLKDIPQQIQWFLNRTHLYIISSVHGGTRRSTMRFRFSKPSSRQRARQPPIVQQSPKTYH